MDWTLKARDGINDLNFVLKDNEDESQGKHHCLRNYSLLILTALNSITVLPRPEDIILRIDCTTVGRVFSGVRRMNEVTLRRARLVLG